MKQKILSSKKNVIDFEDMAHEKSGDYYNKKEDCMDCLVWLEEVEKFAKIGSYVNNLKDQEQETISQSIWKQAVRDL